MIAALLVLVAITNAALSALVIKSDSKNPQNKYFSVFLFAAIFWALGDALMLYSNQQFLAFIGTQLFLVAPLFTTLFVLFFSMSFPDEKAVAKKLQIIFWIPMVVLGASILISPDTFIKTLQIIPAGQNIMVPQKIPYYVYTAYFNVYFLIAYVYLIKKYLKSTGYRRAQLSYSLFAIIITSFAAVVTNLTLPNLGKVGYVWAGPVFMLFFAALISVAIVRHQLLDVRAVVVRSLTYIGVISTVAIVYSTLVFGVGDLILPKTQSSGSSSLQRLFYVAFALFLAVSYQPIKKFFDKVTNRLFYQDSYDSQEVLDAVSSVIVGNIDPHKVQKGALSALFEALRPTYVGFLLYSQQAQVLSKGHLVGQSWEMHDPAQLRSGLQRIGKKILLYENLEQDKSKLRELLKLEDINLVAPLVTKDESIGYLIMGPKKSGNLYNSQDLGLLNIASNELAVALQNAQRFEEIQAFNLTLQEKVTDATRELKQSNKKLIALDEAKDEFISMASHQLRTPLTSIKGYLSMIIEGDLGKISDPQEKALKEAFGSSQRMVYLIADFLNVSRIKTGKFMIEPKEVNLPQIVQEEITQLREMADSRELKLVYDQPEEFPTVMLDDNKIRQVMMNMVDNAIYYTPSGGTITIQLYSTGDDIIFKVVDDGIGVPKAEQHKLFTKFYRAGNARKSRPDGTGLGLFMAQKIVVEQGGAIIFESEEGKGSTFGWRFPLAKIRA